MKKIFVVFLSFLVLFLSGCTTKEPEINDGDVFLPQTVEWTYNNGNARRITKYTYDEYGNITSENVYNVSYFLFIPFKHHLIDERLTHTYDGNNRIIQTVTVRDYYEPPLSITGDGDSHSELGKKFIYNEQGLLVEEGYYSLESDSGYSTEYMYEYDENGNRIKKSHHSGASPILYTYDGQNRLIKEENTQYHRTIKEYFYDSEGKLEKTAFTSMDAGSIGKNEPERVSGISETIYEYDKYGRLTATVTTDFDGNGKQISRNKKLYSDFIKIK